MARKLYEVMVQWQFVGEIRDKIVFEPEANLIFKEKFKCIYINFYVIVGPSWRRHFRKAWFREPIYFIRLITIWASFSSNNLDMLNPKIMFKRQFGLRYYCRRTWGREPHLIFFFHLITIWVSITFKSMMMYKRVWNRDTQQWEFGQHTSKTKSLNVINFWWDMNEGLIWYVYHCIPVVWAIGLNMGQSYNMRYRFQVNWVSWIQKWSLKDWTKGVILMGCE